METQLQTAYSEFSATISLPTLSCFMRLFGAVLLSSSSRASHCKDKYLLHVLPIRLVNRYELHPGLWTKSYDISVFIFHAPALDSWKFLHSCGCRRDCSRDLNSTIPRLFSHPRLIADNSRQLQFLSLFERP
jgi:hypothetical protein